MSRAEDRRLTAVFEANQADLLRYICRRVDSFDDASDVLGDSMVAAWRNIKRMPRTNEQARMWLFGIARNALLNAQRGARRRTAASIELAAALRARNQNNDPAEQADALDVRRALLKLPAHLAELLRLVHWEGFSITDAASVLDTPASTARSQYAVAKSLLRAELAVRP